MVTLETAEKALKAVYLGVVANLIDTEKVCEYGRV